MIKQVRSTSTDYGFDKDNIYNVIEESKACYLIKNKVGETDWHSKHRFYHAEKRSLDSNGVLPLTNSELIELNYILRYNFNVTKVRFTGKCVRAFGAGDLDREIIDEVEAILWLDKLFELDKEVIK